MLEIYCKAKHRAGTPGYYEGRPRGCVAVWHDSKLWIYEQPPKSRRAEMKRAIESAFCRNGEKVRGTWPNYTIE